MAKSKGKSKATAATATATATPSTGKNIRIKNLLNQAVKISLQRPGQKLTEVTLPPRGELPNIKRPAAIAEEEVTSYTKGLVDQKRLRITEVA